MLNKILKLNLPVFSFYMATRKFNIIYGSTLYLYWIGLEAMQRTLIIYLLTFYFLFFF